MCVVCVMMCGGEWVGGEGEGRERERGAVCVWRKGRVCAYVWGMVDSDMTMSMVLHFTHVPFCGVRLCRSLPYGIRGFLGLPPIR